MHSQGRNRLFWGKGTDISEDIRSFYSLLSQNFILHSKKSPYKDVEGWKYLNKKKVDIFVLKNAWLFVYPRDFQYL